MQIPVLEDIVECLGQRIIPSTEIDSLGLYDPDILTIFYNPIKIQSKDEFILTILHEIIHRLDLDEELDNNQTELLAEYLSANKQIRTTIRKHFKTELKRYKY
jgi:hypothetical protein